MKSQVVFNLRDNGGRRSNLDRRKFLYSDHIPERRYQKDRRGESERRFGNDRRSFVDRRSGIDRRDFVIFENFDNA